MNSGAVMAQWSDQSIFFLRCPRKHVQETAVLAHCAGQQLVGNWVCCGWTELKSRTINGPALPIPPQWHLQQAPLLLNLHWELPWGFWSPTANRIQCCWKAMVLTGRFTPRPCDSLSTFLLENHGMEYDTLYTNFGIIASKLHPLQILFRFFFGIMLLIPPQPLPGFFIFIFSLWGTRYRANQSTSVCGGPTEPTACAAMALPLLTPPTTNPWGRRVAMACHGVPRPCMVWQESSREVAWPESAGTPLDTPHIFLSPGHFLVPKFRQAGCPQPLPHISPHPLTPCGLSCPG